jgi:hypothetical protein
VGGCVTDRPAPPYPAETLAKGWRFELDMEKFKRSDTWKLAKSGQVRGALLLLWAEAWQESPCGTLPDDDTLIALTIDMPEATFAKHRAILRRGWTLASDGRLYHDVITARVLAMLDKRANDAQRAANRRARTAESAKTPAPVTPASRVTNAELHGEFDTKHQAPSTRKEPKEKAPAAPPPSVSDLVAAGFDEQTAVEFIAAKAARKAPLTARAWADHLREAAKAGWTPLAAADKVLAKSWKGFEAKYVANEPIAGRPPQSSETSFTRDRKAQAAAWMGSAAPRTGEVIDMETPNGPRLAVG